MKKIKNYGFAWVMFFFFLGCSSTSVVKEKSLDTSRKLASACGGFCEAGRDTPDSQAPNCNTINAFALSPAGKQSTCEQTGCVWRTGQMTGFCRAGSHTPSFQAPNCNTINAFALSPQGKQSTCEQNGCEWEVSCG